MTPIDLLVVGAGPTGIAIGAAGLEEELDLLLVERGGLCEAIRNYPTDLEFFTTRERLEIAGVPFAIAEAKPTRRQVLAYYREVARTFDLPLALHEEVTGIRRRQDGEFDVATRARGGDRSYRTRAVALATGYFGRPQGLGVPGEDRPWVSSRYREPYGHFGDRVLVVGAGNSAVEAALELYRWGAEVTMVHRGREIKEGVKYWLRPDIRNRIHEGSIEMSWKTEIVAFDETGVRVRGPGGERYLPVDAAYVMIGYLPELALAEEVGVVIDPETLQPEVDARTLESNVPGFYIAGTLIAGRFTDRIFIENSRDHGPRIAKDLAGKLAIEAPVS